MAMGKVALLRASSVLVWMGRNLVDFPLLRTVSSTPPLILVTRHLSLLHKFHNFLVTRIARACAQDYLEARNVTEHPLNQR